MSEETTGTDPETETPDEEAPEEAAATGEKPDEDVEDE